jgi:type II secretion system protein N
VITIPPRLQRPLTLAGYPLFGLAVLAITVFASVPRERVKDRLESTLSADPSTTQPLGLGMDVSIGELAVTLFSGAGLKMKDIVLRTRPQNGNDKPVRLLVDDVTVKVGLFGLAFSRPTYAFKAHGFSGVSTGEVLLTSAMEKIKAEASALTLTGSQPLQQLIPLPIEGTATAKLDLTMPKMLFQNSDGSLSLEIEDAAVGDGKAKITPQGMSDGLAVPKLRIGKLALQLAIEKGRAKIDEIRIHSADLDATLEGYLELRDPLMSSQLHAYVRVKPSEALLKREPKLEAIISIAGGIAKRPDGFFGIQLNGPLSSIYPMASPNPPPGIVSKSSPLAGAPGMPTQVPPPVTHVPPPVPFSPPPNGPNAVEPPREPPPPPPAVLAPGEVPPSPVTTTLAPPTGSRVAPRERLDEPPAPPAAPPAPAQPPPAEAPPAQE